MDRFDPVSADPGTCHDLGRRVRDGAHPLLFALLAARHFRSARQPGSLLATYEPGQAESWERLFLAPLSQSATVVSLLAGAVLLLGLRDQPRQLLLWTLWQAGLWLLIAVLNRWPALFAAFQAALSLAVFLSRLDTGPGRAKRLPGAGVAGGGLVRNACGVVLFTLAVRSAAEASSALDQVILAVLVVGELLVTVRESRRPSVRSCGRP